MNRPANLSAAWWTISIFACAVLASLLSMEVACAQTQSAPLTRGPATQSGNAPQYPVPYATPSPEQIKQVMDRVRDRLDAGMGTRVVDRRTGQPPADLSQPSRDLTFGPEHEFTPYSYPSGVAYSGMLLAYEVTGDQKYADVVTRRFEMFHDDLPALSKWPREDLRRNPFRNMLAPGNLDACGAIGAAMARARRMKLGPDLTDVIERFADYVTSKQFRLDDGTLARKNPFPRSLWLDDAYMSVPLLAQYGAMTGDHKYFDDAARQIKLFHAHLFRPDKGLYTHGGNMDNPDDHPNYFWGRANGWVMVATVELLDLLPEDHPDRTALIRILRDHAKGVAEVQSGSGLWHQVLDRPDTYLETSCSAMFAYSMAKAVNRGWLDASAYGPVAQAGWNGVTTKVTAQGEVTDVCVGTSYADDMIYYYHRPARDDLHGYGPVLLCGAEMIRLVKNDKLAISDRPGNPVMYHPKGAHEAAE